MSVKIPTALSQRNLVRNQVYIDMKDATNEEKDAFLKFHFFEKIYLYTPQDRSISTIGSILGCEGIPTKIKGQPYQQGLLFNFFTIGGPPFRMYLQLAQMFPNYRFYTKCEGFSDCAYHGRETFYFGERGNTRDCTMGVGHFGEGCTRRDRFVLPFTYPVKK